MFRNTTYFFFKHFNLKKAISFSINSVKKQINLIRENKTAQIPSVIQTSAKEGMVSMEAAVKKLHQDGLIAEETIKRGVERGKTF